LLEKSVFVADGTNFLLVDLDVRICVSDSQRVKLPVHYRAIWLHIFHDAAPARDPKIVREVTRLVAQDHWVFARARKVNAIS
jgi:hypothetical protein